MKKYNLMTADEARNVLNREPNHEYIRDIVDNIGDHIKDAALHGLKKVDITFKVDTNNPSVRDKYSLENIEEVVSILREYGYEVKWRDRQEPIPLFGNLRRTHNIIIAIEWGKD